MAASFNSRDLVDLDWPPIKEPSFPILECMEDNTDFIVVPNSNNGSQAIVQKPIKHNIRSSTRKARKDHIDLGWSPKSLALRTIDRLHGT